MADAALAEKLLAPGAEHDEVAEAARVRHDDPSWLPRTAADRAMDARIARLALTVAMRRHARPAETADGRTPGRDLSSVRVVVASGGVFRHAEPDLRREMLDPVRTDHAGGWKVPLAARLTIDQRYVVAAAGLLADDHTDAATTLLHGALVPVV